MEAEWLLDTSQLISQIIYLDLLILPRGFKAKLVLGFFFKLEGQNAM